jgi:transcriptional regulator with XRE-family HTH domain
VRLARGKKVLRSIGANVRRLRVRAGLTQEALGELARVQARYVQDVERAHASQLSVVVLAAIADALEVDVRVLFRAAELFPARPGRPPKKTRTQRAT